LHFKLDWLMVKQRRFWRCEPSHISADSARCGQNLTEGMDVSTDFLLKAG
jgi:hypothetical protein